MTDKELLVICHKAFEAMPVAAKARKVLKALGSQPKAYAGNGSDILAKTMRDKIDEHLKGGI